MLTSSTQPLFWVLLPAGLMLCGCTPGPQPLRYGAQTCAHCVMTLSDARYGAQLVTPTGKTYAFDSVECLAAFVRTADAAAIHSLWVTDYARPETLIRVEDALFLHGPALRSPMGAGLAAFAADAPRPALDGALLDWPAVLALTSDSAHALVH